MSSLCESLPGKPKKKEILYTIPQCFISGMSQGFGFFFQETLASLPPSLFRHPRLLPSQMRKMKKKSPNKRSFSPPPYFSLNRRDTPKYRKKSLFGGFECVCQISFWIISRDFPWKKREKYVGSRVPTFVFFKKKKTNFQTISKANFCTQRDDSPANWKIMLVSCMHILVTHVRVTKAIFHISFSSLLACFGRAQKRRGGEGNLPPRSRMAHHQFSLLLFFLLLRVCVGIRVLCCRPPRLEEKKVFFAGASRVVSNPPKWRACGVKFGTHCRMRYNTP